jgi:hypothetical protein
MTGENENGAHFNEMPVDVGSIRTSGRKIEAEIELKLKIERILLEKKNMRLEQSFACQEA